MRKLEGQRMKKGAQKKEDGDKELEPHASCEMNFGFFWERNALERVILWSPSALGCCRSCKESELEGFPH